MDLTQFNTLTDRVAELQKQMKSEAEALVTNGTKKYFEEHGNIVHSFGWTQYTPYFNDGDECVFGMHELSIIAKEDIPSKEQLDAEGLDLEDYMSEHEWDYGGSDAFSYRGKSAATLTRWTNNNKSEEIPNPIADPRFVKAKQDAEALYNVLAQGSLSKDIFGDHVKVTFTERGVDVEDYYHD